MTSRTKKKKPKPVVTYEVEVLGLAGEFEEVWAEVWSSLTKARAAQRQFNGWKRRTRIVRVTREVVLASLKAKR